MKNHTIDGGMVLPRDAFATARQFLMTSARPLERARFRAIFEDGPVREVLAELSRFRNDDDGFGRALEPDVRAPESSALCTSLAFQILREFPAEVARPIAESAIHYLLDTIDSAAAVWRIIPQSANTSPHAPWWSHADGVELARNFGVNPTAELLGYLYDWSTLVPHKILDRVRTGVFARLEAPEPIDMHALSCYLRLSRTRSLPDELQAVLNSRLQAQVETAVEFDPAAWTGYVLRPLDVIDSPDSPFANGHEDSVAANLDHLIGTQQPDGSWIPTWSWDGAYPEAWELARTEWSGVITLGNLVTLRRFGRIPRSRPRTGS